MYLALGVYPEVSLADAREQRNIAREQLRNDIDPSIEKKKQRLIRRTQAENTFEAVARNWVEYKKADWDGTGAIVTLRRLEQNVFPRIGSLPISEVTPVILVEMLRKIESRGALETARKICQYCGQIFRFAVVSGLVTSDITRDIRGALKTRKKIHLASIDVSELPEFLQVLERNDARLALLPDEAEEWLGKRGDESPRFPELQKYYEDDLPPPNA